MRSNRPESCLRHGNKLGILPLLSYKLCLIDGQFDMDDSKDSRDSSVSARAYQLWDAAGRPEGEADRFWFEAEHELGGDNFQIESEQSLAQTDAPDEPTKEPSASKQKAPKKTK